MSETPAHPRIPVEDLSKIIVPQPVTTINSLREDPLVRDTYLHPVLPVPDVSSRNRFEDYLEQRLAAQETIEFSDHTTRTRQPVVRMHEVTRIHDVRPSKVAAAIGLALFGAANVSNIVQTTEYVIERAFGDDQDTAKQLPLDLLPTQTLPSEPTDLSFIHHYRNNVGESQPDKKVVRAVVAEVKSAGAQPDITADSVTITASSSDDWGGAASLTRHDQGNKKLAEKRGDVLKDALYKEAQKEGVTLPPITVKSSEHVLTSAELSAVNEAVERAGYTSFGEAFHAYNKEPKNVPAQLRKIFDQKFTNSRSVEVEVSEQQFSETPPNSEPITQPPVEEKASNKTPLPKDWNFWPLLAALVPAGRLRKEIKYSVKDEFIENKMHGARPVAVRLYPEALEEDGLTLRRDAWAYTRKYQLLMREQDRIKGVLRLDYKRNGYDPQTGESTEVPAALRAMFVDHVPDEDTVNWVTEMLQHASLAIGRGIDTVTDMIAIYPSQHAGTGHKDPRKIGLGIDSQYGKGVLGVTIPMLGLIEMHMPPREPKQSAASYYGSAWVLAHELLGHAADVNPGQSSLKSLGGNKYGLHNLHPFDYRIALNELTTYRKNIKFAIPDPEDPEKTITITGIDPRLPESTTPILLNRPTMYADTSMIELQAEGAAATTVVNGVVPSKALPPIFKEGEPDYKPVDGQFRINPKLKESFQARIGSNTEVGDVQWSPNVLEKAKESWRVHYGPLTSDPHLLKLTAQARIMRLPKNKKLITVLGIEAI